MIAALALACIVLAVMFVIVHGQGKQIAELYERIIRIEQPRAVKRPERREPTEDERKQAHRAMMARKSFWRN